LAAVLAPGPGNDTFAANRAEGRIALTVAAAGVTSRRARVHEHGSLRVRFPHAEAGALEAVIVNTAGGIAGGDAFAFDIAVGADAQATVTTAAAEKVYRSLGPDATMTLALAVAPCGELRWLPQETILFDQARLRRTVDIDVAAGGRLILAEALVLGRTAMGESVAHGRLFDRWRVRRDGRLVFADTMRLDGAIAERLAEPAVAAGGVAVATVLLLPGDETVVAAVRARQDAFGGDVGITAWNGVALARLCAADGATVRRDLTLLLAALGERVLPRLWLN
jgi:urease accessory protein